MRNQASVHTVSRALDMLAALGEPGEELAVRDFSALLGVHRSTASRLAATLAAHGFLQRSADGDRYRLGPEVARLGLAAVGGRRLVDAARPTLDAVAAAVGETVVLAVPAGDAALDVAQAGSGHVVGASSWVGRRTPLHASSDGKVFLAFGAARLPAGALAALTDRTVTDRVELARRLAEIRVRGWARAVGDLEEGLNGVAAPVFGRDGACIAAVSISGPAYRLGRARLAELGPVCVRAAGAIGAELHQSVAA